ncbi:3-hydroxybutyryl-CoA dehydrogenase [Nitratireductor sp. L15S-10]|uniref:3-hydroxybutyryl-CoA dehydrogenase n=1 Tax=Nitratireductor sp. L15S-10 TaxID=3034028 RepID=UPI00385758DB
MADDVTIACIGAGRMGRGIAQCVAYAGHQVRLIDAKERDAEAFARLRDEALDEIRTALASIAALGAFKVDAVPQIMERVSIVPRGEAAAGLAGARIVFEGVPEVADAKRDAFALFDAHADGNAILASTTSTMLSTELAGFTTAPERFLNAHWLNPAFLMPLVELSPADETEGETVTFLRAFLEGIGKVPIVCKASPGYIVPRIQALAMNEAARIVEEGVASAEDVDKAVTYGFGLRFGVLGLLEFIDWGGGDILYYASRYLAGAFNDERYQAPEIISRNMEEGRIGLKTGSGFFDYSDMDVDAYRQRRMAAFLKALDNAGLVRPPVI